MEKQITFPKINATFTKDFETFSKMVPIPLIKGTFPCVYDHQVWNQSWNCPKYPNFNLDAGKELVWKA